MAANVMNEFRQGLKEAGFVEGQNVNGDPVAAGLVASLNRPGGNLTGVTIFGMMAAGKRLELLRQLMPKAGTIAYLMNPNNPNREFDNVQAAARCLDSKSLF
jgi:putative tryptophan/tyrosine transport system substrate-binding protein